MSKPDATTKCTRVRKRDGQTEPFQKAKIAACLRCVVQAGGEGTAATADELAAAVSHFLVTSVSRGSVRTFQIAGLLERVLEETGHPRSAGLLREHARQRDRQRRNVRVLAWKASLERTVPRRWNKSVLAARLQKQHDLEPGVARFIAGRVERVVLGLDLRLVTGGLVRELADSELLAWGLSESAFAVKRRRPNSRH